MSAPDKCPHCGADQRSKIAGIFFCGSTRGEFGQWQSPLCEERAAHAATKLANGSPSDEPNPNGSTHARLNWWKDRTDGLNNALAAIKQHEQAWHAKSIRVEDEMERQAARANAAEREVTCAGYAAQKLRGHVGLDNTKEDLCEVAELFDALQARVRELEGLKLGNYQTGNAGIWLEVLLPEGTKYDSRLCNTLGEAIPAGTWGPYKLENDGWYKLQPDHNEAIGGAK